MPSTGLRLLRIIFTALTVVLALGPFWLADTACAADDDLDEGVRLYGEKSFKNAISHLKRVNDINKPTALYYEALCLQGIGDATGSIQIFRQIKQSYPRTREGRMVSAYFNNAARAAAAAAPQPAPAAAVHLSATNAPAGDVLPDSCTVPFHRGVNNHMFVRVLINGRPAEVMFDTGASTCLFGKRQLQNIGATYEVTGKGQAMGVGSGTVDFERANLRITLGDITKTINTAVAGSMPTESLLGQDFFNEFRYDIDTAAGVIHFQKKGARSYEALDTINIPFKNQGKEIIVMARVNGRECEMIFDTGAYNNCFTAYTWLNVLGLNIPPDAARVVTGGVGGSVAGFQFRADRIELGAVMKTNVPVVVIEKGPPYPLLGQEFFKDKRFTIDNDNHVIKFVH